MTDTENTTHALTAKENLARLAEKSGKIADDESAPEWLRALEKARAILYRDAYNAYPYPLKHIPSDAPNTSTKPSIFNWHDPLLVAVIAASVTLAIAVAVILFGN